MDKFPQSVLWCAPGAFLEERRAGEGGAGALVHPGVWGDPGMGQGGSGESRKSVCKFAKTIFTMRERGKGKLRMRPRAKGLGRNTSALPGVHRGEGLNQLQSGGLSHPFHAGGTVPTHTLNFSEKLTMLLLPSCTIPPWPPPGSARGQIPKRNRWNWACSRVARGEIVPNSTRTQSIQPWSLGGLKSRNAMERVVAPSFHKTQRHPKNRRLRNSRLTSVGH
jgi:hypothetical protein